MDHLALYRKYRPDSFENVLGQEHIVKVLANSVETGNVSHAYLFIGSRGTGKTSLARIFAAGLGTSQSDLYEIDAASNRGIEDIRELRDGVRVLPFDSKYKIYIIDEVHMLSRDAWGALLKTLEEPPKHVIFILATTELHKVPDTIVSRCQTFVFKKPTDMILKNHLNAVSLKEGYTLEEGGAELIAILGDGSFRDALGVLDKVLNFAKKENQKASKQSLKITLEEIESVTGSPKRNVVNGILSALGEGDLEAGLNVLRLAVSENLDMDLLLKLILQKFRIAVILKYAPSQAENMRGDLRDEDLEFLKDLVKNDKGAVFRSKGLINLLEAYANINNAFIPSLPLEIALIDILNKE
ncbi:MAG: DNA polymerase III subunit gamma/tau [Candidatus Paceibacterota bacterium]